MSQVQGILRTARSYRILDCGASLNVGRKFRTVRSGTLHPPSCRLPRKTSRIHHGQFYSILALNQAQVPNPAFESAGAANKRH